MRGTINKTRQNLVLASENGCKICSILARDHLEQLGVVINPSWPLQYKFSKG